jgi:nucleolar complex protein 3
VLYFRILKFPKPTRLLPGALEGISRFAHLVNIDFFRDLLATLKELIVKSNSSTSNDSAEVLEDESEKNIVVLSDPENLRHRLLCITTAFELLSGQGKQVI